MRTETKHILFIAICCCLLIVPGVVSTYSEGATATFEITARVLLTAYDVSATNINTSAETITWMTNGWTNSTVEYGLNTAYGSNITIPDESVFSHSITLLNLSDSDPYHYRVVSYDSAGNNCSSPDYNFTTQVSGGKSLIGDFGSSGSYSTIGSIVGLPVVDLLESSPALTIVSGNPIPMTADNLIAQPVDIITGDGSALLSIDSSTRILDRDGQPLSRIDLNRVATNDIPVVPAGSLFVFAGYAYQIEPSGATFSPLIALEITPSPEDWKQISGQELSIQYFNPISGLWEELSTTTDPTTHTVTTMIAHASDYGLFIRPVSPPSSHPIITATTTVSGTNPVPGGPVGPGWIIVVQAIALISAMVAIVSTGLYFYRNKKGP